MKLFSLIRQLFNSDSDSPDLIGLPIPVSYFLGDKHVELINPEWVEDSAITNINGSTSASPGFHYSITDVSKFDYVIIPCNKNIGSAVYSGLCAGPGTSITYRVTPTTPAGNTDLIHVYMCMKVESGYSYAAVTTLSNSVVPIIGIKEQ